ncbi:hypothetical protein BDW22DRAFT_1028840 [Trametopsis cervina]|nr:hypothetical protein BDW22DRAFT_1028840 [Trametopsis cervina]
MACGASCTKTQPASLRDGVVVIWTVYNSSETRPSYASSATCIPWTQWPWSYACLVDASVGLSNRCLCTSPPKSSTWWVSSMYHLDIYAHESYDQVEAGLSSGTPDRRAIFLTLVARVVLTITIALWRRWTATADEVLETQVRLYFQQHLLEIHCTDLQDAFDFSSENPVPSMAPPQASALLFDILEVAQYVLAVLSQLVVLFTLAWSREDGKTFFIVCLAKPIYNLVFIDDLFSKRESPVATFHPPLN